MATSNPSVHASVSTPVAVAADVLWKYQLRREHKALLDLTESNHKQALSKAAEFERLASGLAARCAELENTILSWENSEDLQRKEHKVILDRIDEGMKLVALKEAEYEKQLVATQNDAAVLAARVRKLEVDFLDLHQDPKPMLNSEQRSKTQSHPDDLPQLPISNMDALKPPQPGIAEVVADTLASPINPIETTTSKETRPRSPRLLPSAGPHQVDIDQAIGMDGNAAGTSLRRKRRADLPPEEGLPYTKSRRQSNKADSSKEVQKAEKPVKLSQRRLPMETYYNNANQYFPTLPETGHEAEVEFVNSFLRGIQGAKGRDKVIRIMQQLHDSTIFNKQVRIECRWDQVLEGLVTAGMVQRQS